MASDVTKEHGGVLACAAIEAMTGSMVLQQQAFLPSKTFRTSLVRATTQGHVEV